MELKCEICGSTHLHYLGNHLYDEHGMDVPTYQTRYPQSQVASPELMALYKERNSGTVVRKHPTLSSDLKADLMGYSFHVNVGVPSSACLSLPDHFKFPEDRSSPLYNDFKLALLAMLRGRSLFVHGLPGSGKDAFFHAFSALTRRPGLKLSIKPGVDIQSWFYARALGPEGTFWEEGVVLKALRDGYPIKNDQGEIINRVPYLVVFSDFDRADRAQAEYMRLILDTIEGEVEGPGGQTYPVLPGTIIAATSNTAGGGDGRGRMISSNVIDGSIMDRWDRVYEFHWMSWKDEGLICEKKFPALVERAPGVLNLMGKITATLRQQIKDELIYGEFSHRAVCQILSAAEDQILVANTTGSFKPEPLIEGAFRCWLDRLPDEENRENAKAAIAPLMSGGLRPLPATGSFSGLEAGL